MNIFSEIYGAYYRAVGRLLSLEKFGKGEIRETIECEAFRDSALFIEPKLLPKKDGSSDWELILQNDDGSFSPVTKNAPPKIVTELHKRWLKAKLTDPRFALFFEADTLKCLTKRLENVKPLYDPSCFRCYDVYADGDDHSDTDYRKNFRTVLNAVKKREILKIDFVSGKNEPSFGQFLPLKIEYSRKNDKFRVFCYRMLHGHFSGTTVLNIGRMTNVRATGLCFPLPDNAIDETEKVFGERRCREPVQVEVSSERNGIERFMMEFAGFEKQTELDMSAGKCMVRLWYDSGDETELLIRLLGFGPVLRIIGPEHIRKQAAERVEKQFQLLFSDKGDI